MRGRRVCWLAMAAAMALSAAGPALAGFFEFFGEDPSDPPTPALVHPKADAAQAAFLANLPGASAEDFESFTVGQTAPLTVHFGAGQTATITGGGHIDAGIDPNLRFPISGQQYWEATDVFTVELSSPQAAFGFYGTDIGDFGGQLTLTLATGGSVTLTVPHSLGYRFDGSALYYGFLTLDPSEQFTRITFGNTAAGWDIFGFDDVTIGSLEDISYIPEPTTLVLLGLGAAGLLLRRRR